MKNLFILYFGLFAVITVCGCASNSLFSFKRPLMPPPASIQSCTDCHSDEYATWSRTAHASAKEMKKVPTGTDRLCGACHDVPSAHPDAPDENKPASIATKTKTEQNAVCGKCHFDSSIVGWKDIDPKGRHGLFMSVGLDEKYKTQLSCLDCHEGHGKHADMLVTSRAHLCFTCHKEAIVTMGIVQPINYLTFGKACFGCHSPHGGSTAKQWTYTAAGTYLTVISACNACHISQSAPWQWWGK